MRAVLVDAEWELERRRKLGLDKMDERWDGEWHLVNPPKRWHAALNSTMFLVLAPLGVDRGLSAYCEATGLFEDLDANWRVPDQVYARHEQEIDEGVTGAELVVEVRSPGDESYLKLPFYAERGVSEVLIVHQDRRFDLYRLVGGEYEAVEDGRSTALGVTFSTVEGPKLRIDWEGGTAEV
jgi:Uma2 family endonuclease